MTTFTTEDRLNAEVLKDVLTDVLKNKKVSKKELRKASPNVTPYMTSTGIQIGKYYQKPKYVEEDSDMLRLQSYLIFDPARLKRQYWMGVTYKVFLVFILLLVILVNK